jgi:hypothetical protein
VPPTSDFQELYERLGIKRHIVSDFMVDHVSETLEGIAHSRQPEAVKMILPFLQCLDAWKTEDVSVRNKVYDAFTKCKFVSSMDHSQILAPTELVDPRSELAIHFS